MAPPSFTAHQLPRHAQPKTNAQKRAAAAAAGATTNPLAAGGGRRGGGSAEGTAGSNSSGSAAEASAAAKQAKAKNEMEAMRVRVVEQYKALKLKQHADKEHGAGSARR
jgi:hypothetical protein